MAGKQKLFFAQSPYSISNPLKQKHLPRCALHFALCLRAAIIKKVHYKKFDWTESASWWGKDASEPYVGGEQREELGRNRKNTENRAGAKNSGRTVTRSRMKGKGTGAMK